ncbi:MAG: LuxR C-terminal-related transcriptional regulator [Bacteroidota bacterium]|nr:LuxR C-terminal-related transcriptional regulator [Bacteroidota bacterium]
MKTELTKREDQIVELIALGQSQKEVANALHISPCTVDVIVKHAKEKLHVQKASELSVWYFVTRYKITLNLSDEVRRVVSLSFLSLMLLTLSAGFRPERTSRVVRTSTRTSQYRRTSRGTESEIETTLIFA